MIDKLYIKNWCIGLAYYTAEELIRTKTLPTNFSWVIHPSKKVFYADPFLLKDTKGNLHLYCEELNRDNFIGGITKLKLSNTFKVLDSVSILKNDSHYSYPFLWEENNRLFLMPENSAQGNVIIYELNPENLELFNPTLILEKPLLDSTILYYKNKYWLFGFLGDDKNESDLYIYYSEQLLGGYKAHAQNPVKSGLTACRPAGSVITVDGNIYRPTQNNKNTYGESVTITKINKLTEDVFEEEDYMVITADNLNGDFERIHTINFSNGILAIDTTYRKFAPFMQLKKLLKAITTINH